MSQVDFDNMDDFELLTYVVETIKPIKDDGADLPWDTAKPAVGGFVEQPENVDMSLPMNTVDYDAMLEQALQEHEVDTLDIGSLASEESVPGAAELMKELIGFSETVDVDLTFQDCQGTIIDDTTLRYPYIQAHGITTSEINYWKLRQIFSVPGSEEEDVLQLTVFVDGQDVILGRVHPDLKTFIILKLLNPNRKLYVVTAPDQKSEITANSLKTLIFQIREE